MRYKDMDDTQAVDAIVEEVRTSGAGETGWCDAGWAMLARLRGLRKRLQAIQQVIDGYMDGPQGEPDLADAHGYLLAVEQLLKDEE